MTDSTAGVRFGTRDWIVHSRHATSRQARSATKIWMTTACGAKNHRTDRSGFRELRRAGLLINMDTGFGWNRGAGLGWMMLRGAMLRSTTAAGYTRADIGDGRRVQFTCSR